MPLMLFMCFWRGQLLRQYPGRPSAAHDLLGHGPFDGPVGCIHHPWTVAGFVYFFFLFQSPSFPSPPPPPSSYFALWKEVKLHRSRIMY